MKYYFYGIIFLLIANNLFSQDEIVRDYLNRVAEGEIDEVKMLTVDLLAIYPNDPGVQYLHGVVVEDVSRSVEIFKRIIKNNPTSEWADDAYWRLVIYYAIKGDTAIAQNELNNFRKRYPKSEFLGPATDVVKTSVSLARLEQKPKFSEKSTEKEYTKTTEKIKPEPQISKVENPKHKTETQKSKTEPQTTKAITQKSKVDIQKTKTEPQKSKSEPQKPKPELVQKPSEEESDNKEAIQEIYHLQVGIYSTKEAAEREKEKYLQQRLRTNIISKNVDGQQMYAVVIGEYSTIESAEAAKKIVQQQCKCSPMIFKK